MNHNDKDLLQKVPAVTPPFDSDTEAPEQKPLYVNECIYTKATLLEMIRKIRPTWFSVLMIVFEVLFVLTIIVFFLAGPDTYASGIQLILLLAVMLFLQFGVPRLQAARTEKQAITLYHSPSQVETSFYEEQVVSYNKNSGAKATVTYAQIVKVFRSKNLYLLKIKPQMYILLEKNHFLEGNAETFETFLRTKLSGEKIKL